MVIFSQEAQVGCSVADPSPFATDPDHAFHFDTDPDPEPAFQFATDPDPEPACQFATDPDPEPAFQFATDPDPPVLYGSGFFTVNNAKLGLLPSGVAYIKLVLLSNLKYNETWITNI
jgi:hypothetical protein